MQVREMPRAGRRGREWRLTSACESLFSPPIPCKRKGRLEDVARETQWRQALKARVKTRVESRVNTRVKSGVNTRGKTTVKARMKARAKERMNERMEARVAVRVKRGEV